MDTTTTASPHNLSLSTSNSSYNQSRSNEDHLQWINDILDHSRYVKYALAVLSILVNAATLLSLLPPPPGGRRDRGRGRVLSASRRLVLSLCVSDLLWSVLCGQPTLKLDTYHIEAHACISVVLRRLKVGQNGSGWYIIFLIAPFGEEIFLAKHLG